MAKHKLCYERRNKRNELVSYRFVYEGKNTFTGQTQRFTQTWKVPKGLTHKEIELARQKAQLEFITESEKKLNGTHVKESNYTLQEYSQEWLKGILIRNPNAYSYYSMAENSLKVINSQLGGYKLKELSPILIKKFYDFLCTRTYIKEIVTVKKSISSLIEENKLNKTSLAKSCGLDRLTLRLATQVGNKISIKTAKAIANHFKVPLSQYFLVEKIETTYSKATNQGIRTILVVVLGEAKRDLLIEQNYASKDYTKPITGTTKGKEIYDVEEAKEFVKQVLLEPHIKKKTVLALLIFLGLRKGEICGLSWNDIDFETETLTVSNNCLYLSKFGIVTKTPKTAHSKRTVKLPYTLVNILKDYKDWYDNQKHLYGDLWANTNMLFLQDNGKPMSPCTINLWLTRFNIQHGFSSISPHALRHTCITMQIIAGVPIKTVSERAGHSNERITLDIYTHALKSHDEIAANTYNDFLLCSQ